MSGIRRKKKIQVFDVVNISINILITLIVIYPLYVIVISSFSDPNAVASGKVFLIPVGFNLDAYENIIRESRIWVGYRNTILYTLSGVCYDLLLTIPAAYVMSKKYLPFRNTLSWYFFITMYVAGGLIPSFLLIKGLHLLETPFAVILGSMSCYNMIIARQYFSNSIPESLYEAAEIDGASEIQRFLTIGLPLAKPIIAVIALFRMVDRWNGYMSNLLYVHDRDLYSLQQVLREILITNQMQLEVVLSDANATIDEIEWAMYQYEVAQSMKYSVIFIACLPLLIAYPFVQKHFVKGVMIGSVKG